ncbi:hypothetical protein N7527_006516, partial [Penicillium freii]
PLSILPLSLSSPSTSTGQATPTNTYKQCHLPPYKRSQHTLTEGFSHRVFITHLTIHYPRGRSSTSPTTHTTNVPLLRHTPQSTTHTAKYLSYLSYDVHNKRTSPTTYPTIRYLRGQHLTVRIYFQQPASRSQSSQSSSLPSPAHLTSPRSPPHAISLASFFPTFTLQFTRLLSLTPTPTLTLPSQLSCQRSGSHQQQQPYRTLQQPIQ